MSNFDITFVFKVLLCLAMFMTYSAYEEIKVFRLVQYEAEDKVFGSQYASLNYIGAHYKGDILRKIALIKFSDIKSLDDLKTYINSNANALLLILPKPNEITEQLSELILGAQKFLSEQTLYIPVYFAKDSDSVDEVYKDLEYSSRNEHPENYEDNEENKVGFFGFFQLENNLLHSLSANDPKKIESLTLENMYGYLEGKTLAGVSNPIIAIVANYDELSIIPDFPSGLNSNASGVIAMMEIMRILSKFYENYESYVHYDVLFLLSSGGSLNYQGSNHFINNLDASIVENIQYVLCLDSLSLNSDDIYVHLSRYPKPDDNVAYRIQKSFNETASNMNINLNFQKKKVFLSESLVPWEHEQYSKKKILTSTISGRKEPIKSLFDAKLITDVEINKKSLKKGIKFVVESLFGILFELGNIDIFREDANNMTEDNSLIDEQNIETLINFFKKYPRTPLNVVKGSRINKDLYSIMNSYLAKVQKQNFEYTDMKFYDSNSGIIKIYSVKSKMIDLYILFFILMYLLSLYIYVKGFKNFLDSIKNAFSED